MAGGSKDEKSGAPALDAVKTEREAEAVARAKEAGAMGGGSAPSPSGDSPKPHGDKMEHAVREATHTPTKKGG